MSIDTLTGSADPLKSRTHDPHDERKSSIAVVKKGHQSFDFLHLLWDGAVAGAAAGVVVESALYPIDTIKTRLQAVRDGGKIVWRGLYSGLAGNLAGVFPASALFVGVYELTKQILEKSFPDNLSALAQLMAGAVGGAASSIVRVPTEVIKQRMQTGQFASAPDAVSRIVAKEGVKGLYAVKHASCFSCYGRL